jgi:hypothetical protein
MRWLTFLVAVAVPCGVPGPAAAAESAKSHIRAKNGSARFKITKRKTDDAVTVQTDKERMTIVVHSPSGISQAIVEPLEEAWPQSIILRLHLKGLESFRASNGTVALDAAVSSQDGKVRIWKDGKEDAPLDEKSPFWLPIRVVGEGKAANGRYFEIALPRALFAGNPKAITLAWIVFYR